MINAEEGRTPNTHPESSDRGEDEVTIPNAGVGGSHSPGSSGSDGGQGHSASGNQARFEDHARQGNPTDKNENESWKRAQAESHEQHSKNSNDNFEFKKILGSGGFGEVWLVYDRSLNHDCAIKIIDPMKVQSSVSKSIQDEIKTILEYRNKEYLCNIYRMYNGDKGLGMVMEWLRGETLASWITGCEHQILDTLPERWRLFREIVRGVAGLHDEGFIHLDLKPENVFLEMREESSVRKPILVDLTNMALFRTFKETKEKVGFTPTYAPPEQILCTAERLDARCDIYALGMVGYELFGGRPIMPEIRKTKRALSKSKLSYEDGMQGFMPIHRDYMTTCPPHAFLGVMPRIFNDMLLKMIEPEPDRRGFLNAREVDTALENLERSHPMPWVDVEMEFANGLFGDSVRIQIPAGEFG